LIIEEEVALLDSTILEWLRRKVAMKLLIIVGIDHVFWCDPMYNF